MKANFAKSIYTRRVADAADLLLRNRHFEQNPSLSDDGAALLARPGLKYLTTVGDGPIRAIASEPGVFGGDLFVVSYDTLYRVTKLLSATSLIGNLFSPDTGTVNFAFVQAIGETPERVFFADGRNLMYCEGDTVSVVATPLDIGMFDVVSIASYVICIPVQEGEFIGRFYWIEPGEVVIDPLNFATAESHPDGVLGVESYADRFWLPGEKRTEVWYPTGNPDAPMERLQGVVFDRGTWEATATAIKETLIVVDADGGVFAIRGGAPQRISHHGIEETIRGAIELQQNFTP